MKLMEEIEDIGRRREQQQQTEREKQVKELQDYFVEANLTQFDEDIFRRVVEKVKVQSMAEVEFVFKVGIEVREILGD